MLLDGDDGDDGDDIGAGGDDTAADDDKMIQCSAIQKGIKWQIK